MRFNRFPFELRMRFYAAELLPPLRGSGSMGASGLRADARSYMLSPLRGCHTLRFAAVTDYANAASRLLQIPIDQVFQHFLSTALVGLDLAFFQHVGLERFEVG